MSRPRRSPEEVAESRRASKARSKERALADGKRANGSPRTDGKPGRKPLTPEQEAARKSLRAVWAAADSVVILVPALAEAVADAEARARAVGLTWSKRKDGTVEVLAAA